MGLIHSVETFGAVDGPGVRYVVFLQGCPMRCLYCHNPDSIDPASKAAREISSEELVREIAGYKKFLSGGVTLSGGEPLLQHAFCADIIARLHKEGIHTAMDTSGGMPVEIVRYVLDMADLLLLDIKAFDDEICRALTGRSSLNAWETLDYCESAGKPVWIRHVLVPGYTLDKLQLTGLADALKEYACVKKVELLPFHKMGEYKWEELGRVYQLYDTPIPTEQEVQWAKEIFMAAGLPL